MSSLPPLASIASSRAARAFGSTPVMMNASPRSKGGGLFGEGGRLAAEGLLAGEGAVAEEGEGGAHVRGDSPAAGAA